jgi:hypothetical protein
MLRVSRDAERETRKDKERLVTAYKTVVRLPLKTTIRKSPEINRPPTGTDTPAQ